MYLVLLMAMQAVALIVGLGAVVGLAVYLFGLPWLCLAETRPPEGQRRPSRPAPNPPEPDEYDLLVTLACLDGGLAEEATRLGQPAAGRLTEDCV